LPDHFQFNSTGVHPIPSPAPPVNVRGCIGKDFYFPPSDPSALQVLWTGPNGYSSTNAIATIPNVQYSDTGMYRVKETFYFGCVLYDTFYLKVFPGTSVNVQPATPLCEGQSEHFQQQQLILFNLNGPHLPGYRMMRLRIQLLRP
jgi:hypothetical protein